MDDRARDRLLMLSRFLFWAAGVVLVLAVIAALQVVAAESQLPGLESLEREGRGAAMLGALVGGITASGILAGLGGILRALVLQRDRE